MKHVTIFYVDDAVKWCTYLHDLFTKDSRKKLNLTVDTLNLDEMEYENPPQVQLAIKESYLLILLASPSMLDCLDQKRTWLGTSLSNLPTYTTVVPVFCYVEESHFNDVTRHHYHTSSEWKRYVIGEDLMKTRRMVAEMVDIIDGNETSHTTPRPVPARRQKVNSTSAKERTAVKDIIPSKVYAPKDPIVIVFNEPVDGTVQVQIGKSPSRIDTRKLNPYTYRFKAPDKAPGLTRLQIFVDSREVYKRPFYYVAPNEASFQSVQYLVQAFKMKDIQELDTKLVDLFEQSLPEDHSLHYIFDNNKDFCLSDLHSQNRTHTSTKSESNCPTLLHFAAGNGLSELCAFLLDAPGSLVACQIENREGNDPADLAEKNNNAELADYIRDYMETKAVVDACDLYVHMVEGGPANYWNVQKSTVEDFYMDMDNKPVQLQDSDDIYVIVTPTPTPTPLTPPPMPTVPKPKQNLPPVPRKNSKGALPTPTLSAQPAFQITRPRNKSERNLTNDLPPEIPERKCNTLPHNTSPEQFMGMLDSGKKELPSAALGSSNQKELIDIMESVKAGEFTQDEADRLFKAWKERYDRAASQSFRDRQKTLKKMREDFGNVLTVAQNTTDVIYDRAGRPNIFKRLISRKNSKRGTHRVPPPQISEPVYSGDRQSRQSQLESHRGSGMQHTRLSNISCTSSSSSSSRDSCMSMSDACASSSENEDSGDIVVRESRHQRVHFFDQTERRQSRSQLFLEITENIEEETPPLPPRTYSRSSVDLSRPQRLGARPIPPP